MCLSRQANQVNNVVRQSSNVLLRLLSSFLPQITMNISVYNSFNWPLSTALIGPVALREDFDANSLLASHCQLLLLLIEAVLVFFEYLSPLTFADKSTLCDSAGPLLTYRNGTCIADLSLRHSQLMGTVDDVVPFGDSFLQVTSQPACSTFLLLIDEQVVSTITWHSIRLSLHNGQNAPKVLILKRSRIAVLISRRIAMVENEK